VSAAAVLVDCRLGRGVDLRMPNEAQITVGGKHLHLAAIDHDPSASVQLVNRLVVKVMLVFSSLFDTLAPLAYPLADLIVFQVVAGCRHRTQLLTISP